MDANGNAERTRPERESIGAQRAIPLAAEILGYVGGALALGAVVALLTAYWDQLGFYGRTGIALGVTLAGLLGGWAMARSKAPAAGRLSQFLLFVGVAGAGAAVGFDAYEMAMRAGLGGIATPGEMFSTKAAEWAWFAGFATVALVGGAVWWRRRTTMQHIAFGLGVGIGTLLLLPLLPVDGPYWGAGATIALVGIVWGSLGLRGWLPPDSVALTLASLGVLGGIQMMYGEYAPVSETPLRGVLLIGLAVSVAMVVGSIVIKRMVLLGFGAAGIVLYAFQLIDERFAGTIGAPIAMLVAGLLFVGMAVMVALLLPRMSRPVADTQLVAPEPTAGLAPSSTQPLPAEKPAAEPIPLAAEILGYVGGAFAVGAAIALMTTFWTQLGLYGRLAVASLGAAIGIAGGFALGRQGSKPAHRLERFMLAIGTVAAGFAVGILAYEFTLARFGPMQETDATDVASNLAISIGALCTAVTGYVIWRRRQTGLQLAVFGIAAVMSVSSGLDAITVGSTQYYWAVGSVMAAFGVLFGIGALMHVLPPENIALAIGSSCVLLGIQSLTFSPIREGMVPEAVWGGLAVSIGLIAASIPLRRGVLLGFGAAGVVMYSAMLVGELFAGQIAGPIMLLVVGVVFIAMAVLVAVMLPRLKADEPGGPAEPPPMSPHIGVRA